MKKFLFVLPLVGMIALSSVASADGGCSVAKDGTVEKTMSWEYHHDMSNKNMKMKKTTEARMSIIKNRLDKASEKQLEKFLSILERFAERIDEDHPRYYVIDMLQEYVASLLDEADMESATIVDIVVDTPKVSILKDVVVALDLVDTLASDGPFTVFAPTNEAFENLLEDLDMTFDELAANTELLETVVLYHVVGAKVPASDVLALPEGALVETVSGESVRVSTWNGVFVDDSKVIKTDIMASNGVIHLIDEVLLPSSVREALELPTDRGVENIVTTAVESGDFPTLVAAVQAAGLVDALSAEGPFTVFAPTEEAFSQLLIDLEVTAEELLTDTDLLTTVLTYHVIPGFYSAADVVSLDDPTDFETLQGDDVEIDGENLMVNDSNIVGTDVFASNGVIHVIDKVLVPSM